MPSPSTTHTRSLSVCLCLSGCFSVCLSRCLSLHVFYYTLYLTPPSFFFCVCCAPDLVGALTGIRVNSVSRWHHWFPRRYSQEGRARVDPGFVNADAILPTPPSVSWWKTSFYKIFCDIVQ